MEKQGSPTSNLFSQRSLSCVSGGQMRSRVYDAHKGKIKSTDSEWGCHVSDHESSEREAKRLHALKLASTRTITFLMLHTTKKISYGKTYCYVTKILN